MMQEKHFVTNFLALLSVNLVEKVCSDSPLIKRSLFLNSFNMMLMAVRVVHVAVDFRLRRKLLSRCITGR